MDLPLRANPIVPHSGIEPLSLKLMSALTISANGDEVELQSYDILVEADGGQPDFLPPFFHLPLDEDTDH